MKIIFDYYPPWKWPFYPDVLAVELVPGVAVRGRHHRPVVVLGECWRLAVLQEHDVLLVTTLDPGHRNVGRDGRVVGRRPLFHSEPEAELSDLNTVKWRLLTGRAWPLLPWL